MVKKATKYESKTKSLSDLKKQNKWSLLEDTHHVFLSFQFRRLFASKVFHMPVCSCSCSDELRLVSAAPGGQVTSLLRSLPLTGWCGVVSHPLFFWTRSLMSASCLCCTQRETAWKWSCWRFSGWRCLTRCSAEISSALKDSSAPSYCVVAVLKLGWALVNVTYQEGARGTTRLTLNMVTSLQVRH